MNPVVKFDPRPIINQMKLIENLLNNDLKNGEFDPQSVLHRSEINHQLVNLFIKHWADNFGDTITLYRGTKYGSRTKKERRVDIWKPYPLTISPSIAYKFAMMKNPPIQLNEKQIPIVIEYEFDVKDLKDKVDSVPFHFISIGSGYFSLEESEMEFTFKGKPECTNKSYYKPLRGFRFRKMDTPEMKENKFTMITNFKIFEEVKINQRPIEVSDFVYHTSNPFYRDSILKKGLLPKIGNQRLGVDIEYEGLPAVFASDTEDEELRFFSTYDDDIYKIDTKKANVKWYRDYNMGCDDSHPHVVTFEKIPPDCLELVYKGTGKDRLNEIVTPKSSVQMEFDRLIDKGVDNLTQDELDFLKNPNKPKEEPVFDEIDKYYNIAEDFFKRVIGMDIRNFDLNDKLDLFDILSNDEEVNQVVKTIYYMYGIEIDPENNDDFKLVNIFKKIHQKIRK